MSSAQFGDAGQEKLRTLVANVEHELTLMPSDANTGLRAAWVNLVTTMALGPSPETRICPKCGGVGMKAATRCGSCWIKLTVPA